MHLGRQILAATGFSLRSIPQRLGNALVIVIGIAGVVAVLASVLAMANGFRRTIHGDARADRAIVLTRGAESGGSGMSSLSPANVAAVESAPGIKKNAEGKPLVSAEALLVAPVSRKNNADAYITLRGVSKMHFAVRPEFELIAGRMFEPGLHEVIVGQSAHAQFVGLELGNMLRLHDGDWKIVGIYAGGDNVRASEVMTDAQTMLSAYKLNTFNGVTVVLDSANALRELKAALARDPTLTVDVLAEPDYLAIVSRSMNRLLGAVAYLVGGIMSLGALFGALNTMYSAVIARTVELGTLRAIGFRPVAVVVSLMLEALLLSLLGAGIGVAIAFAAFDGRTISTLGGARWDSQLVYALTLTPGIVATAVALACVIGLIGGALPAVRAARVSVAAALRTH